jgi:hypothetical protein
VILAGAICEETDCTGLVLFMLALLAAFVVVVALTGVAWAMTISTVLHRRGWTPASRRAVATLGALGLGVVVWGVATVFADAALVLAVPVVSVSGWVAVRQRRLTRRVLAAGDDQSSPCSTA